MSHLLENFIKKNNIPYWWIEAIILEYLNCRHFAINEEISTYDFTKINEDQILRALSKHKVCVMDSPIVHNVHRDVLPTKIVSLMIGKSESIAEEPDDMFPNGLISEYSFLFFNRGSDPKHGFGTHFQVLDEGNLYQWRIANFEKVEGRHYGKWISSEVDLEPLDQIYDRLIYLKENIKKPGEKGHKQFEQKVREFYGWLDQIRKPILSQLWIIHKKNKKENENRSKVIKTQPPLLSHFEKFTVRKNKIYTKFFAEAVFYRSCKEHAKQAQELAKTQNKNELVSKLDQIYQERSITVIMAAACLESFVNNLGYSNFPGLWDDLEKLSLVGKWNLFLKLKGKDDTIHKDEEPYQTLQRIYSIRNNMVHHKSKYVEAIVKGKTTQTNLEHNLSQELIDKLVTQVKKLITEFCSACEIKEPFWLD